MSSEAVKKRGRPKKVISDPVEVEMPESTKKSTTRAKSTKATVSKPVNTKTPTSPPKASVIETPVSKPATSPMPVQRTATKAPPPNATPMKAVPQTSPSAATKSSPKTPVTPETSKILSKVREMSAKPVPPPSSPTKSSNPSPTSASPKASPYTQSKAPPPRIASKPSSTPIKPPTPPTNNPTPSKPLPVPAKPVPKIPIAALNSQIVSNISSRAGARQNTEGSTKLPPNYKQVARKITMTIVALPIAIVTSYVLYQRLVLGEDRKVLVRPGMAMVDAPRGEDGKTESSPAQ